MKDESAPSALTVSKCENFDSFFSMEYDSMILKTHFFSLKRSPIEQSKKSQKAPNHPSIILSGWPVSLPNFATMFLFIKNNFFDWILSRQRDEKFPFYMKHKQTMCGWWTSTHIFIRPFNTPNFNLESGFTLSPTSTCKDFFLSVFAFSIFCLEVYSPCWQNWRQIWWPLFGHSRPWNCNLFSFF